MVDAIDEVCRADGYADFKEFPVGKMFFHLVHRFFLNGRRIGQLFGVRQQTLFGVAVGVAVTETGEVLNLILLESCLQTGGGVVVQSVLATIYFRCFQVGQFPERRVQLKLIHGSDHCCKSFQCRWAVSHYLDEVQYLTEILFNGIVNFLDLSLRVVRFNQWYVRHECLRFQSI